MQKRDVEKNNSIKEAAQAFAEIVVAQIFSSVINNTNYENDEEPETTSKPDSGRPKPHREGKGGSKKEC
jgi:hypothetical protein